MVPVATRAPGSTTVRAPEPGVNPQLIADRLQSLVLEVLEELVARHLPQWRIPGTFGGHPTEPDVAADLAFTLAHLHDLGIDEVARTATIDAIEAVLAGIDGERTHTFFSYRVAEALARFGRFDGNQLISGWSQPARDDLVRAVDSTEWLTLLDEGLPRNYAAVLARCELARRELGLAIDDEVFADLLERTASMLDRNPAGFLDDSTHGVGRTDIYTVDIWLFTDPLAALLGERWQRGLRTATDLVERVGSPDGTALPWGRSTGALAVALTIELAALVLTEGPLATSTQRSELWLRRADAATSAMAGWFTDGLTSAHQHRSPYRYRGPFRRLQMTLDLLGKLAWSAGRLGSLTATPDLSGQRGGTGSPAQPHDPPPGSSAADAHPHRDELVGLDPHRATSVWTHQGPQVGFVVPFVGATTSDYLAAPRRPGLFEVPVDSAIACWVPTVVAAHRTWSSAGVPISVSHRVGGVSARWEGFEALGELDPPADAPRLAGSATVDYRVAGRTVTIEVDLSFEEVPDALGIVVPEVAGRPLRVEVLASETDRQHATAHSGILDTAGIAEWRSFNSELPVVHQVDLDTGRRVSVSVAVTPTLRVASSGHGHHYDRSLYGPLESERRALSLPNPLGPLADPTVELDAIDLYHLHWPEWMAFDDVDEHRRVADELAGARIPVVWTAHNLTPHDKRREVYDPIYRLWAERADAVIHHSSWGESRMREQYRFAPGTRHVVIPHGHFGDLYPSARAPRDEAEALLGLPPAAIRIGVLGAPRAERDVAGFLRAAATCANDDLQVCCWSLDPGTEVPDDPRITVAESYEMVDATTYGLRLAACDVIALPFDPHGEMLATGVAADVVGCAKAALVSGWPYLTEVLGDAGIPMGDTVGSMTSALNGLDADVVTTAARCARSMQRDQSWEHAATLTAELFEGVVSRGAHR